MAIPYEWRYRTLHNLTAPATAVNLLAMAKWAASEGTPPSWNNWLATTMDANGAVPVNSAGVKHYPNLDVGALATARTILLPNYRAVLAALRQGTNLRAIYEAIHNSPWCRGCQGNLYPGVLFQYIASGGAGPPKTTPVTENNNPSQPSDIDWPTHIRSTGNSLGGAAKTFLDGRKALDRAAAVRPPKPWKPR